ncbi:MAG: DEAD/DEAH box helicase [Lachnospiraceae bacterium]|nr:DEAD/DEAH box helicase [Lachnospiraceae bacterium]
MAIDFRTKMKKTGVEKKKNPVEIYDELDRTSVAGPLRSAQVEVLTEWFENHVDDKDIVIKLHTGEGKTLIGLLILLSKLNMNKGPCLYICPNKYLVNQVCKEAIKFGIPVCTIGENNNLPNEFMDGQRVLVTHAKKVFNGKSIFGIANSFVNVGAVVLDDAHACLDSIRETFVVSIKKKEYKNTFNRILRLFETEMNEQGAGSFWDIKNGEDYDTIMAVPYWSWIDKIGDVLSILAENSEEKFLLFTWDLIKDSLHKCQAFISGGEIQIVPITSPIELFNSFHKADTRILMSATTQDDIFFVKTLDFSVESIKNPIQTNAKHWSGEKMVLLPSLIDDDLTREEVIKNLSSISTETRFGIVSLVSTKKRQDDYAKYGCIVVSKDNIDEEVSRLQNGSFGRIVVFANRYDGIDLPDTACRILIIDSMPFFTNMRDKYEEKCRIGSSLIGKKMAQKIEQGIGRCVRSEKDYAAILIIGAELVSFIRSSQTKKFFSEQTRKQVELGLQMAEWAKEEQDVPIKKLISLINQCLKRDEGWKDFYKSEMDSIIEKKEDENSAFDILQLERTAEKYFLIDKYEDAAKTIQQIIDKYDLSKEEKGWYLQEMARYKYSISKIEADRIQKSAFENNNTLLKPREGIIYRKLENINSDRMNKLKERISEYPSYEDLMLIINMIVENLSFGIESDKFEDALDKMGVMMGYETQRPDKMIRKGPDNLWRLERGTYALLECKSEVLETRDVIYKSEVGQMNNHCGWFDSEYPDAEVIRILIIPTNKVSYDADFTHDVLIMTQEELERIKKSFKSFYKELKTYDIHNLDVKVLDSSLKAHNLCDPRMLKNYSKQWSKEGLLTSKEE